MGINVRLESESGEAIAEVLDPHGRTKALVPNYSDSDSYCLRFVDRYGDAVFNQLQLPLLVSEVRRRHEIIQDRAIKQHAEDILKLLASTEAKVHTYVRFFGD